jgi:hypothetical protein
MAIHHLAVELGNTDRGQMNYLKAHVLLIVTVVIFSLMKNFLDLNSLMFNNECNILYYCKNVLLLL